MSNFDSQISRMKAMMNYGLQTENKNQQYKSVEYQKLGADGKTYGIVREGTKYYIKVSESNKPNLLKEDFKYIGGFINRKNDEYTSYANALKNFEMKMSSIKESVGDKNYVVETWNPEKNEYLVIEATDKMKAEIDRQRQIMNNASMIMEGKECNGKCCASAPFTEVLTNGDAEDMDNVADQDGNNIGKSKEPVRGKVKKTTATDKAKTVKESAEPLAWHKEGGDAKENIADTYMDTTHGTEIGDSAPFDKAKNDESELENGTVEEEVAMHAEGENQNSPEPGVNDKGDSAPFDEKVNESVDECGLTEDDDIEDDVESDDFEEDELGDDVETEDFEEGGDDLDGDDVESDDFGDEDADDELEPADDSEEDDKGEIESLKDEISQLKDMISSLMDKVGVSSEEQAEIEFNDEPLYDGETEEDAAESEIGAEDGLDDDFEEDDDFEVYESASYKRLKNKLNEDRLNVFGKHPAYQKKVMELPPTGEDKNEHGEDWNDESVYSEEPFGTKIGSSAPFEVDHEKIDNAIAESIKKVLGSRKNF